LWSSSLDKVLAKIVDPNATPNWESGFSERQSGESADPIGAEAAKIVKARLQARAKKQDKVLPKVASPEYAALVARDLEKRGTAIRAAAEAIVAARIAAAGDDDDDDDLLDDDDLPGAEAGDESEP